MDRNDTAMKQALGEFDSDYEDMMAEIDKADLDEADSLCSEYSHRVLLLAAMASCTDADKAIFAAGWPQLWAEANAMYNEQEAAK